MTKINMNNIIADFFAKTGRLIANKVPLLKAIEVNASEQENVFSDALNFVQRNIEYGKTFSQSLEELKIFPESLLLMLSAAEKEGNLDEQMLMTVESIRKGDFSFGSESDLMAVLQNIGDNFSETIPELVEEVINQAYQVRASDVHIEASRGSCNIRFRIDGYLQTQERKLTFQQYQAFISRLKIIAAMDPAEHKLPQDGRIIKEFSSETDANKTHKVNLRVSICPFSEGEKAVIRFLDPMNFPNSMKKIMNSKHIQIVEKWLHSGYGMIFVTGPTGSGKTTTLYLMLQKLGLQEGINVVTVEDPVEINLSGVNQMQIQPGLGLTFTSALRALLQQDPDVVGVGEIRDTEIAKLISQIALTGHLVLSQLHTIDAVDTISLLTKIGIPVFALKQTLIGTISQKLVRKLCPYCKEELSEEEKNTLNVSFQSLLNRKIYKAKGCDKCHGTGYIGRLAIYEMYEPKPEFWNALNEGKTDEQLRIIVSRKTETLLQNGLNLIQDGLTSPTEVARTLAL